MTEEVVWQTAEKHKSMVDAAEYSGYCYAYFTKMVNRYDLRWLFNSHGESVRSQINIHGGRSATRYKYEQEAS